jgi:hypothetical protein
MSRPGGFQNDDVVRGAGMQAAKGAGLVALAIIIGIVLLQIVDDGSSGPVSAKSDRTTTTTQKRGTSTAPTTATTGSSTPAKAPDQVRVLVLNAGAQPGAAADMATALQQKGYTNQPEQPNDWAGVDGKGTSVFCKPDFEREAVSLAMAVGPNTKTPAFPDPAPPFSDNVDCVVAVGDPV